jgi:hypothetical protein
MLSSPLSLSAFFLPFHLNLFSALSYSQPYTCLRLSAFDSGIPPFYISYCRSLLPVICLCPYLLVQCQCQLLCLATIFMFLYFHLWALYRPKYPPNMYSFIILYLSSSVSITTLCTVHMFTLYLLLYSSANVCRFRRPFLLNEAPANCSPSVHLPGLSIRLFFLTCVCLSLASLYPSPVYIYKYVSVYFLSMPIPPASAISLALSLPNLNYTHVFIPIIRLVFYMFFFVSFLLIFQICISPFL